MSFRTAVRSGTVTTLTTYQAANPTLLRSVRKARPASLTTAELPCAWIDSIDAPTIVHHASIRQSELHATVTIADRVPDSEEAADRQDALIDALLDAFTAAYHAAGSNTNLEPISYAERLVEEGATPYIATDVVLKGTIAEGTSA